MIEAKSSLTSSKSIFLVILFSPVSTAEFVYFAWVMVDRKYILTNFNSFNEHSPKRR